MGAKLIDFDAIKERGIPYSRRNLRRLELAGKFPKRVKLGHRTVAWVASEIDQHVATTMAAREAA